MHFSAKRSLAIACRPSVCLWRWWIMITQVGNLGNWLHRLLAQRLCSLQPKGDPPSPRGTWGNFGETRGRVGKMAFWRTEAAISLKRVKIEAKLLWRRAYRNSPMLFRTVPSPTPLCPLLPPDWGFATRLPLLSQEQVKLRISNLAVHLQGQSV